MKKVLLFSMLLIAGLVSSQYLDGFGETWIRLLTMFALAFIMIHVGYEFEIDKSKPRQYMWDYVVAGTAAAFPWIFCALYFVFVMAPPELWQSGDLWKENLLVSRFASPTSAGVLFSMLAAAGLASTWLFKKARVLAIFDDLDTVLLMIPLKALMVGLRWQLGFIVAVIGALLWIAWKYLHRVKLPVSWPFVMGYAGAMTLVCELIYVASKGIDARTPIHIEVLLPAFVMGCILARPAGSDPHVDDGREGHLDGPESPSEQRVATIVSAAFMVLVGLSMPALTTGPEPARVEAAAYELFPPAFEDDAFRSDPAPVASTDRVLDYEGVSKETLDKKNAFPGWGVVALHVLFITVVSNIGKMFPVFCYRREASPRERFALSLGMCPRGEVGAGVLVVALSYGIDGPTVTVAVLSLALNLLLTGVIILAVKRLLAREVA